MTVISKKVIGFFMVLVLFCSGPTFARPFDDLMASGFIRVGVYENFPPYSFKDEQGQPRGVDVELAKLIANEMDLSLELFWMLPDEDLADDLRNYLWRGHVLDHDHRHERLSGKKVADLLLRIPYDRNFNYARGYIGEGVFAYQNDLVVMTMPYHRETWALAHDTSRLEQVRTLAVFQYHPVAVEMETVPAFMLASIFNGALRDQARFFRSASEAFNQLAEGSVAAAIGLRGEIEWFLNQSNSSTLQKGETVFPAMGKQQWDVGIAVREADRQLGYHVEGILEPLVMSGEIAEIFERYGISWEIPSFYDF
jgi:ABC-type amino acid transport substrate-binding protein